MARPLRIEYPGAVYHVTSRGNGRDDIYLSDIDREIFLEVMKLVVDRFGWLCHAYCLMIKTPKGNLSQGMRQLNGVYTQRFNREHNRVGHVFQGRYKAILIEKDAHLLALSRYIVRNPVAAGMVDDAGQWLWSSYRLTAGIIKADTNTFCTIQWVLDQFNGSQSRYIEYVETASTTDTPLKAADKTHVLGDDAFREIIQRKVIASSETPNAQKHVSRRKLADLASGSLERAEWMTEAYRKDGYTMAEIATYAGVHYSLVSKIIKAWEDQ